MPGHRGIRGHRRLRIGQSRLDRTATSRRRIQRIPADDREVPSPYTREPIKASPLDPPPDLAGALRGVPDSRGLPVVSRPELPQRFQKFALIIRRMFSRPVPLRVSDHPPSRSPTVARLISFVATWCGDQVFFVAAVHEAVFLSTGCENVTATVFPASAGKRHKAAVSSRCRDSGVAGWVTKRQKACPLSDVPAAKSRWSPRAPRQSPGNWMTSATSARSAALRRSAR